MSVFLRVGALTRNAVIDVIPSSAEVYVEVDLLEFSEENLQTLIEGYEEALDELRHEFDVHIAEPDDLYTMFDEVLYDEFRMTVEDDIMPWIGRYIAVAVFDTAPSTRNDDRWDDWAESWVLPWGDREGDSLVAIQVRDEDLVDRFLEDAADLVEDQGWSVDRRTIDGLEFYEATVVVEGSWDYETSQPYEGDVLFGRSGDVMLIASSKSMLRDALSTQAGEDDSIADTEGFTAAMAQYGNGNAVRGYSTAELAQEVSGAAVQLRVLDRGMDEALGALSFAARFTENGVEAEATADIDVDRLPSSGRTWLENLDGSRPVEDLRGSRAFFAGVPSFNVLAEFYCDATGDEDACETTGDVVTMVFTKGPALEDVLVVEHVDEDARDAYVDDQDGRLRDFYENVERVDGENGEEILVYTREGDSLYYRALAVEGTRSWGWWGNDTDDPVEEALAVFASGEALTSTLAYKDAVASLGGNSAPLVYLDGVMTTSLLDEFDRIDNGGMWARPIRWFVAGLEWDGTQLRGSATLEWWGDRGVGTTAARD